MYILRLLLLLILSLLQPILSERRLIDGRYNCISHSTCAGEIVSLHEAYRSNEPTPKNRHLNDRHEIPVTKHRYEVREAVDATTLSSGELHSERLSLATRGRSPAAIERQQDRTVISTIRNVNRQNHVSTARKNERNTYNSLKSRSSQEESEREGRNRLERNSARLFEQNIFKRDVTRNVEEVLDRIKTSLDWQESVYNRNNERNIRQKYTHRVRNTNIVRGNDAHIKTVQNRSTKIERHYKYNTRTSTEEHNNQKVVAQIKDKHITYRFNKKLSESPKEAKWVTDKNINYDNDPAITKMSERLSGHNIRERSIRTQHGIRQSDSRSDENKRSVSNREERNHENMRDERTSIINSERYAREGTSERFTSIKYNLREQGERESTNKIIPQSLRERTNKRTGVIDYERYGRDSTRKSISIERNLYRQDLRAHNLRIFLNHEERNKSTRNMGTEIRNIRIRSRKSERTAKDQTDMRREDKEMVRSREDRQAWAIDGESDNWNAKRYKRNVRPQPLDCGLEQNVERIVNRRISRNRTTKNTYGNEPITLENGKKYVKDSTRKESTFSKCDIPRGTKRVTNIPAARDREVNLNTRLTRSEDNKNFKDKTRQTVIAIERGKRKSNGRISRERLIYTVRDSLRKNAMVLESYGISDTIIACNEGKRSSNVREQRMQTVRPSLSSESDGYKLNVERTIQGHVARIRGERRLKTRNTYTNVRNVASYPRDVSRERAVFVKHNVRVQAANRLMDRHIESRRQDRITNDRDERPKITNNIRNLRDNDSEKAGSKKRGVLDEYIARNREVQNTLNACAERSCVRKMQRYSAGTSLEKGVLHRLEVVQSDIRNMAEVHISSVREEQRVKYEPNNRSAVTKYSRMSVRERSNHAEQKMRASTERRLMNNHNALGYEHIRVVSRNDRIDYGKTRNYLHDNTRERIDLIRDMAVHSDNGREASKSEVKPKRTVIRNHDREICKPDIRRVLNERIVDEKYSRNNMHDRVISDRRYVRQFDESKNNMKHTVRSHEGQTTGFRDTQDHVRKSEYHVRDRRTHNTVSAGLETRLQNRERTTDDYAAPRPEFNINLRNVRISEKQVRGVIHQQLGDTYYARSERDSRTFNSMRTIATGTVRNNDAQRYRTRENLQTRESEEISMQSSTYEFYRSRQSNDKTYRHILVVRDYSRRNTKLFGILNAMAHKNFASPNEKSTNKSDTLFYWQYLFYVLQGIYICVVFMRVSRQRENDKTSSGSWVTSARFIKVD